MAAFALGIGVPPAIPLMAGAFCVDRAVRHYTSASLVSASTTLRIKTLQVVNLLAAACFASLAVLYAISLFEAAIPYTVITLAPWTLGALGLFIALETVLHPSKVMFEMNIKVLKALGAFFLLAGICHEIN